MYSHTILLDNRNSTILKSHCTVLMQCLMQTSQILRQPTPLDLMPISCSTSKLTTISRGDSQLGSIFVYEEERGWRISSLVSGEMRED